VSANSGKERDALIAAYREGLGLVAIVFSGEGGEVCVVADQNIPLGASGHWWCRNAAEAGRIVSAARASLRRKSAGSRETILRVAQRLNVDLRSDQDVTADAIVVIDRVAAEFAHLRNAGSLRPVNKSYRDYRLAAAARGERVVPYAQWMRAYRENLVRQAAVTLRYL
jgi:hypothetical protein